MSLLEMIMNHSPERINIVVACKQSVSPVSRTEPSRDTMHQESPGVPSNVPLALSIGTNELGPIYLRFPCIACATPLDNVFLAFPSVTKLTIPCVEMCITGRPVPCSDKADHGHRC